MNDHYHNNHNCCENHYCTHCGKGHHCHHHGGDHYCPHCGEKIHEEKMPIISLDPTNNMHNVSTAIKIGALVVGAAIMIVAVDIIARNHFEE